MPVKRSTKRPVKAPVRLVNPPVQEVIFHIRTVVPAPPDLGVVREALKAALARDLPIAEDFNLFRHTVQHAPAAPPAVQVEGGLFGLRFRDKKGSRVAHFTPTGLVVNWVKPYPGYAKCLPKVKALWALYEQHFGPIAVETVSMRYIDRINVPLKNGTVNLSDYLNLGPILPNIEGLSVAGFNQVVEFQKAPEQIRTRVNLATLNPEDHALPVILDHEAFINLKQQKDRSTQAIWPAFEQAHTWSSQFFHGSLTKRCIALFT